MPTNNLMQSSQFAEQSKQYWGQHEMAAIGQIGRSLSQIPQQIMQAQRHQREMGLMAQESALNEIRKQEAQQRLQAIQALDAAKMGRLQVKQMELQTQGQQLSLQAQRQQMRQSSETMEMKRMDAIGRPRKIGGQWHEVRSSNGKATWVPIEDKAYAAELEKDSRWKQGLEERKVAASEERNKLIKEGAAFDQKAQMIVSMTRELAQWREAYAKYAEDWGESRAKEAMPIPKDTLSNIQALVNDIMRGFNMDTSAERDTKRQAELLRSLIQGFKDDKGGK